jgi:hypothetical protein
VAREERGLTLGRDVMLTRARVETLTTHAHSPTADLPTYYLHALFDADLGSDAVLASSVPLIWPSQAAIVLGETRAPDAVRSPAPPSSSSPRPTNGPGSTPACSSRSDRPEPVSLGPRTEAVNDFPLRLPEAVRSTSALRPSDAIVGTVARIPPRLRPVPRRDRR